MQRKTGYRIGAAVQVVIKAKSALSKPIGLGSFRTAYLLYFLYERKMAMLKAPKSWEDTFHLFYSRSPLIVRKVP